jgi:hypothetical protein
MESCFTGLQLNTPMLRKGQQWNLALQVVTQSSDVEKNGKIGILLYIFF